ncbi:DUF4362 domain-containing protein [Bacillus benzoevorans]|uniref:YhfM-like domain-containing protein n=1 Tax=Bacillus benzoevorans TaxID=1456 RepID=A0A7X0LYW3_9BACI|nr:hypothetical protein [Bacillus benzoevorans]
MDKFLILVTSCLFIISLTGCSENETYGSEEAVKRGDVVYQSEVVNLERFEQFLNNLSKNKEDKIRVTGYTHEGDPIYQDLQFDGKAIQYRYDNLNDEYAGNDKGIKTDICTKIVEKENVQGEVEYLISGCSKNQDHFLIRVGVKEVEENVLEEIIIYHMKNGSEKVIFKGKEAIRTIEEAVKGAEKQPGIVNMADPQFKIVLGKDIYYLWITSSDGTVGTIMKAEDTHTIYLLSEQSTTQLNEMLQSF